MRVVVETWRGLIRWAWLGWDWIGGYLRRKTGNPRDWNGDHATTEYHVQENEDLDRIGGQFKTEPHIHGET